VTGHDSHHVAAEELEHGSGSIREVSRGTHFACVGCGAEMDGVETEDPVQEAVVIHVFHLSK
jgi:hypothetical protein